MPEILLRAAAGDWNAGLAHLGVGWGERTVVLGPEAGAIAESLLLAESPPLVASAPGVAVLGGEAAAVGHDDGMAAGSVDLVIAAHAWSRSADLPTVAAEAHRLLRPGAAAVFAEVDARLLASSSPRTYPAALLSSMLPGAAASLRVSCVDNSTVEVELLRAGFVGVATERMDLTRGVFPNREAHRAAVASGLWRGTTDLSPADRERLASAVSSLGNQEDVADREPWLLVRGFCKT